MGAVLEAPLSIVGGGLAGLACAIRLREAGRAVVVHERGRYPLKKVCGEFLSPEGWRRVVSLGAADLLERPPVLLRRARFYAGPRERADFPLDPPAHGLSRGALDAALAARFRALGGDLREGSSADPAAPGVVNAAGRAAYRGPRSWMGWKAYLPAGAAVAELERADLVMVPFPGGYAGLSRVEDGRTSLCLVARAPMRLAEVLASHPLLGGLQGRLEPHAAVAGFRFAWRPGRGRAVGDAGRAWPPLLGDGMARALRGGEELAAGILGRGVARGPELAAYAAARGLHALMLSSPGRRAACALLRRRPGLATRLYAWTRG